LAIITPATDGTLKSATAEGQLQEIMTLLTVSQGIAEQNPSEYAYIQATHNQNSKTYSGTYRFDVSQEVSGDGSLTLNVIPYLTGTGFTPGSDGTFKSTTPEAYALEVLMFLQNLEQTSGANPDNRNLVTGSFNSDTGIYQGSFSLFCDVALDPVTGAIVYTAQEYLTVV
jgi:hypothetical protein